MKKENYSYNFECKNLFDYKLVITLISNNRLFKTILSASLNKLKKKLKNKELNKEEILDQTNTFEVPQKYLKLIQLNTEKLFRNISQIVKEDGIIVTTGDVKKTIFNRVGEKWEINVIYLGQYIKKR